MPLTAADRADLQRRALAAAIAGAHARDWPDDFAHENGQYECRCLQCRETFVGHKRRAICRVCTGAKQP